ncbi:MAG: dihydroorotate dehydrogenase [Maritimibacter sp.]|nr:dihydroorotate dehydrogenase [Maritimibacter sp.]
MSKTDKTMLDDAGLEAFFAAGRTHAPEPGADLMARILADAGAEIDARDATLAAARRRRRPGLWAGLVAAIGGWPALASMATAAVAGVWLGFASPAMLSSVTGGLLPTTGTGSETGSETAYELEDLLPGYDGFAQLAEEGQG